MVFDKLVYRESRRPDRGNVLTVDFGGIGELTVKSGLRGEVNWRRLTRPVADVLRAKLDDCDFGAWKEDYSAPVPDDSGWRLELFDGEKAVKQVNGGSAMPEQWSAFLSVLELCGALVEARGGQVLRRSGAGLRFLHTASSVG